MLDKIKIKPSPKYRKICRLIPIVGRERRDKFNEGKTITVNEDEFNQIDARGWCIKIGEKDEPTKGE